MYGLMRPGNEPLVPYAIRMLIGIHRADKKTLLQWLHLKKQTDIKTLFKLADDFKASFCEMPCKPCFVGVWDTVSSVGWVGSPVKLPYSSDNPDIAIGRHAIAIDERRAFSGATFGTQLHRAVLRTSSRSGFLGSTATWVAGMRKLRADSPNWHWNGC